MRAAVRDSARAFGLCAEIVPVGSLDGQTRWAYAVEDVDVIIHLAARVHVMRETTHDSSAAFDVVNCVATRNLAAAAAAGGVRRLIYVSSIKVNGESTCFGPFTPEDAPLPTDAYAMSKWKAEMALWEVAHSSGLEIAIVRPPLVYGPGVRGNFLRLLKLVQLGLPLPFGAVCNRRSMIFNGNLANALIACAMHPAAPSKTYLVSDGEDLSTSDLVRRLAAALGKRARLLPVPRGLLQLGGALTGKGAEVGRLIGSLQVDSSRIRSDLGWTPPSSVEEGINATARWFANGRSAE